MPTYTYVTDDGQREERVFAIGEAPPRIRIRGRRAYRDYQTDLARTQAKDWSTGLVSEGAAVHVNQLANAKKIDKRAGLTTEYRRLDRKFVGPVFRSRAERKAYLRAHGMKDLSGGYGD